MANAMAEGVGAFLVAKIIIKEVEAMYGVEFIGTVANLSEKFYALSVERKVKDHNYDYA